MISWRFILQLISSYFAAHNKIVLVWSIFYLYVNVKWIKQINRTEQIKVHLSWNQMCYFYPATAFMYVCEAHLFYVWVLHVGLSSNLLDIIHLKRKSWPQTPTATHLSIIFNLKTRMTTSISSEAFCSITNRQTDKICTE